MHLVLLVGGAVVGALGIGGTWRAGVAAAGVSWIASGLLAMYAGRSALVPNTMQGIDGSKLDPERRAAVDRAGAVMGGVMLLILGGLASAFGWALLHADLG